MLVVAGESYPLTFGNRSIWRINTNKVATLVASIPTEHLEGLLTLPNNPTQYGPWAGKLLTADESEGLFYAVDTNGNYQSFALNVNGDPIEPSAMKVIPPHANLYFSDPRSDNGLPPLVLKIRSEYFADSVADILVTRAGEFPPIAYQNDPALFILHWDNIAGQFFARKIDYAAAPYYGRYIEHATFTPDSFDLPPLQ